MSTPGQSTPATTQNMRVKTLEIRWHDSKPICSCDFQPRPLKRARSASQKEPYVPSESYKLATAGEDNNIRIWSVYPHITPPSTLAESVKTSGNGATPAPHPPRVEYLSTLSRHTAAVNVVRWSPNGELIASAGDDGMIIIWTPSATPATVFGAETSEEAQYEKEHWKPRLTFHCTTMQVYDLAWSPTGEYIIAGSTDNTARIFSSADGKCVREIAEHSHYVQGVAWDPMNEYISTQSSDRSVHVYSVSHKSGSLEVHSIGKNTRLTVKHSRTPSLPPGSTSRPRMGRRDSTTSDAESVSISDFRDEVAQMIQTSSNPSLPPLGGAPLTPTASVSSTPSVMFPPPSFERAASSRRSSFSSQAPGSPATTFSSRIARSPSPMPPLALPAVRSSPAPATLATARLYGDENFTNFFRRLTFSPDGALLLTPAGHFEDGTFASRAGAAASNDTPTKKGRGRSGYEMHLANTDPNSSSSVFIYSRANFSRPPIGQIPSLKKASVAVRFSPVLYSLRPGVGGAGATPSGGEGTPSSHSGIQGKEVRYINVEPGKVLQSYAVDVNGPVGPDNEGGSEGIKTMSSSSGFSFGTATGSGSGNGSGLFSKPPSQAPTPTTTEGFTLPNLPSTPTTPAPLPLPLSQTSSQTQFRAGSIPPSGTMTPGGSHQVQTPAGSGAASVFALPYRMLFAIATMDTITIHDTQQASPICLFTKLHYDEFTDMSWSPDGQCLMLSSRDGYCTLVIFDEPIPAHSTQQQGLQLQSIAMAHSHGHMGGREYSGSQSGSQAPVSSSSNAGAALNFPTPAPTPGPSHGYGQGHAYSTHSASGSVVGTPITVKRPLSPVYSEGGATPDRVAAAASSSNGGGAEEGNGSKQEGQVKELPVKKKRRVEVKKVGELDG